MADVSLEPTNRPPDGIECENETSWQNARDGSGESLETGYITGIERREGNPNTWYGWRSVMFFDLSTLSAYKLDTVILTFKPTTSPTNLNGDLVCVQAESVTYGTIVLADYQGLKSETTEYGRITETNWDDAYLASGTIDLTLNAAGVAYVKSKAGSTLVLGFRASMEMDNTSQTGDCKPFVWTVAPLPSLAMTYAAGYPTEAITRVTNIIHIYNRAEQVYDMVLNLGEVTTDFGLPEWAAKPQVAVPEEEPTVEKVIEEVAEKGVGGVTQLPGQIPPRPRLEPELISPGGPGPPDFPAPPAQVLEPPLDIGISAKVTAPFRLPKVSEEPDTRPTFLKWFTSGISEQLRNIFRGKIFK